MRGDDDAVRNRVFDQTAYLTQSGQLYNEATASAFGKVYCFGPTFRAEKSKTRRHLMEFWMVEPEVAFATLEETMDLAEGLVCFILERVLARRRAQLGLRERDIGALERVARPFPRLCYDEAVKMLRLPGRRSSGGGTSAGGTRRCFRSGTIRPSWCTATPPR